MTNEKIKKLNKYLNELFEHKKLIDSFKFYHEIPEKPVKTLKEIIDKIEQSFPNLLSLFFLNDFLNRTYGETAYYKNPAIREYLDNVISKLQLEIKNKREMKKRDKIQSSFWDLLHPKIVKVAMSRYESNHFADSVEAAFKEVNKVVKKIVKKHTGKELDGADLMCNAFSVNKPIIKLADLKTETGKNIQQGYMQIFAGAMTGIRNPKAHDNIAIGDKRAIHFLYLASLLMYKIDEKK